MARKSAKKSAKAPVQAAGLQITKGKEEQLSPAQLEFNRVMEQLEKERAKHRRKQARLDKLKATVSRELMPLIDGICRANCDLVFHSLHALDEIKLSKKRRAWLEDLIRGKAMDVLADPSGLSTEDIAKLEKIILELTPAEEEEDERSEEEIAEEFDFLRSMVENIARNSGLDVDLSDLDMHMDPEDLERELADRLQAAGAGADSGADTKKKPRKQTKAQKEKARQLAEQEELNKRDIKSLYKQLAKALHPDLEPDPQLKLHKEIWMKRLTSAYTSGDLRELLQIEMEWLGEESSNLASAGEEKLKIYCNVLKEQIRDLKRQTMSLVETPEYSLLHRFMRPFSSSLPKPKEIKYQLQDELTRHREMLETLQGGGAYRKAMVEQWADAHGRSLDGLFSL